MTGPITWEQLLFMAGSLTAIVVVLIRMWFSITGRIDNTVKPQEARIGKLEADLTAYKLEVNKTYASMEHMKMVEERLVKSIDRLGEIIEAMPDRLFDRMRDQIEATRARATRNGK